MNSTVSPEKHIISSKQFDKAFLLELFKSADDMKANKYKVQDELNGKIVGLLFYEASTRTRLSFESALVRLGAEKLTTESASEFSSASKGETLEDTIRIVSNYCDFLVLRHFEDNSSDRAVKVSSVPVVNAGSGKKDHPTQALLDAYTIYEHFGRLDNLDIALAGDLKRGRTIDSLVELACLFEGNRFYFLSPENSVAKDELKEYVEKCGLEYIESNNFEEALHGVDVCYMTRVQKERFDSLGEYEKAKGTFILNKENIANMKEDAIIMHPLPRVDEISVEVDKDKRAYYFKQAANGVYVRMALLKYLNDKNYS